MPNPAKKRRIQYSTVAEPVSHPPRFSASSAQQDSVRTPVASRGANPSERGVVGIGAPPADEPMVSHGFTRGDSTGTKDVEAGALAGPPVTLSSARHPSPLPVEQRLGVSPRENSPMAESPAKAHAEVTRALNNDGLRFVWS